MDFQKITKLLGADADNLLNHQCKTHIIVKLGIYPINKSELAITYDWVESLIDNRT